MLPGTAMKAWAQAGVLLGQRVNVTPGVVWVFAAMIGAVLVGGAFVYVIRKKAVDAVDGGGRRASGLSIDQIDRLHQQGLLTDEEYDRTRRAALGLPPRPAAAGPDANDGPESGEQAGPPDE